MEIRGMPQNQNLKYQTIAVSGSSSDSSSGSSHSSGGSSGGRAGGGGGSPEPAKMLRVKEISQAFITSGKEVKFDFTQECDLCCVCEL